MSATHTHEPLARRVQEKQSDTARVLMLPTGVRDVVSWRGSFRALPDFAAGDLLTQELTVMLLDKGTQFRDRFALSEALEDRGAQLKFNSDGFFVTFSGRALREDVPEVMHLMAEQLKAPLFDAEEFEKARAQLGASIQRSQESTGSQATAALTRRLYSTAHPNYNPTPDDELADLDALAVADVASYHQRHFGARDLIFAFVGDVVGAAYAQTVDDLFGDWSAHPLEAVFEDRARPEPPGWSRVPMPDKANLDVRFGQPVTVRRQDASFILLYVANYILGGNFSSRLMDIIRDEMGLTYGIHSALMGITTQHDGHWQVNVTLSQENLDQGIAATQAELVRFIEGGVTAPELDEKKTTITGAYLVNLATTGGLANMLLTNAERGFDVGYLDGFTDEVAAVTLASVNQVIREQLSPDAFHLALAGTL